MNASDRAQVADRRRAVVVAGHSGDLAFVEMGLVDEQPSIREASLGALDRLGVLTALTLEAFATDVDVGVRRRVAELGAKFLNFDVLPLLSDDEPLVVEMAAWSCGEHEVVTQTVLHKLIELTTTHSEPLVREASVAALGAIGDELGLDAIITACSDKPAIRRRAVLALAPFDTPEVKITLHKALEDRDWQVRQAAEDLLG
ncbi:MAG: HEAT repeat domain-containing protein [Actinomycetes bacterium]